MCFLKSGIIKIGLFWGVKEGPWKMIFRHVQKVQVLVIEFTFNKGSFGVVFFSCMFYGQLFKEHITSYSSFSQY